MIDTCWACGSNVEIISGFGICPECGAVNPYPFYEIYLDELVAWWTGEGAEDNLEEDDD